MTAAETAKARRKHKLAIKARLANERMKQVQTERDQAIREAVAAGVTLREIAQTVGLSHQRIAQIVKEA
jgi:DNA-binding NarL/FixJ family response regulator